MIAASLFLSAVKISQSQIDALAEAGEARFLNRISALIQEEFSRRPAADLIQRLLARGRAAGLESEQHLAGYIFLAFAADAERADPPWLADVLQSAVSAEDRIRRLFEIGPRHLEIVPFA